MVAILLFFLAFLVNFAMYKSVESLFEDEDNFLPRWLKYILVLVPPMAIIGLVLVCIYGLLLAVYETIKNI